MKVGIYLRDVVLGTLLVLSAVAVAVGYVVLVTIHMGNHGKTGSQFLLIVLLPLFVPGWLAFVGMALASVWNGLTRYELTVNSLTIKRPLGSRPIAWLDITDFRLPPSSFPQAPAKLVIRLRHGRPVSLPPKRFRERGADPILLKSVPGLAEWGIERVRLPEPVTLSIRKTRWKLHRKSILTLCGSAFFLLLLGGGTLLYCWDLFNYFRISRSHNSVAAVITDIERDDSGKHESVHATVRYVAASGQAIRLRRHVMVTFADKFKVGDGIVVDYLRDHPRTARIPDWDMDVREWIFGLLTLPIVWMAYRVMKQSAAELFRPLRDVLAWGAKAETGEIVFPEICLESLYKLLPEEHAGAIVLKPPFMASKRKKSVDLWARWFKTAGIPFERRQRTLLLFDAQQADRLLERLGGDNSYPDDYAVLATDDVSEHVRVLQEQKPSRMGATDFKMVGPMRMHLCRGAAGFFDAAMRARVFQDWMDDRLNRLFGGLLPPEIPSMDWAELFNIDSADGLYQIVIERRKSGPIIWLRVHSTGVTTLAECTNGRWQVTSGVRAPRLMKTGRRILRKAA